MWLIIRKPDDVHAELARGGDVLRGDVGLGAVGRDPHRADAERVRALRGRAIGADAGQQQRGQPGPGDSGGDRRRSTPRRCGCPGRRSSAGAGQAVAVGDLDRVDPGRVERGRDRARPARARCRCRMACMPSRRVTSWMIAARSSGHLRTAGAAAIRSPTRSAAEVMMSRLPGVGGQVVPGPLDLEQDGDLVRSPARGREGARTSPSTVGDLDRLLEPVAGHVRRRRRRPSGRPSATIGRRSSGVGRGRPGRARCRA